MAKLRVNGIHLYYELTGDGPPLVVIAGQGTGPAARQPLIDGLAKHHTVLSFDPRGTGRGDPAPQGDSMETLAQDALALMDAMKFETASIMGLSTGTGQATVLAANHSDRVERLVLASPWTHGDADFHTLQNLRKAAARTMAPEHYVHFNALLLYYPPYRRVHAEQFNEMARQAIGKAQDAESIAARLDAILAFDARPLYARIACPALVCGARDDLVMPFWFAEAAAQAIPAAQLFTISEGGHMFFDSRTEEFLHTVLPFLNRHA
ncbi:alpha/beta fold hydrolase [Bordetella sp. BOR01]|uniref:alpha/beta fold hydrolase n=1 Tax=Bordetella sp. BOR01 TaxID=2854779 RepID=UPI001C4881EB|nr:alpha/beta hydrolase [Bordetella sp. BOR01]MBV7483842.1 alpha/beta hydrolase [Bordetella sp. BOR01]